VRIALKNLIMVAGVCALALAACAPLATSTAPASGVAASPVTTAELGVEAAFTAAASAELDAKNVGLLAGDKAAKADDIRHQAYAALLVIRTAAQAGRTPDTTAFNALIAQLQMLTPKAAQPAGPQVVVPTIPN
jgi:hypothetical protein